MNTVVSEGSMLKQEYCWERRRQVEKGSSIYRPRSPGCSLAVIPLILFPNNNGQSGVHAGEQVEK